MTKELGKFLHIIDFSKIYIKNDLVELNRFINNSKYYKTIIGDIIDSICTLLQNVIKDFCSIYASYLITLSSLNTIINTNDNNLEKCKEYIQQNKIMINNCNDISITNNYIKENKSRVKLLENYDKKIESRFKLIEAINDPSSEFTNILNFIKNKESGTIDVFINEIKDYAFNRDYNTNTISNNVKSIVKCDSNPDMNYFTGDKCITFKELVDLLNINDKNVKKFIQTIKVVCKDVKSYNIDDKLFSWTDILEIMTISKEIDKSLRVISIAYKRENDIVCKKILDNIRKYSPLNNL